jgi:hypothetical protein
MAVISVLRAMRSTPVAFIIAMSVSIISAVAGAMESPGPPIVKASAAIKPTIITVRVISYHLLSHESPFTYLRRCLGKKDSRNSRLLGIRVALVPVFNAVSHPLSPRSSPPSPVKGEREVERGLPEQ